MLFFSCFATIIIESCFFFPGNFTLKETANNKGGSEQKGTHPKASGRNAQPPSDKKDKGNKEPLNQKFRTEQHREGHLPDWSCQFRANPKRKASK
jgi:hypothetical protein